jgi:hypothetical protein
MTFVRRRSTKARVRPGDILETHAGKRFTYQHVGVPGTSIIVHPTGTTHPTRPRRVAGFADLEWSR